MSSFLIGIQIIYKNVSQKNYLINCVFLLLQGPQRTMPLKSSRQNESHGILFWAESHESRHSLGPESWRVAEHPFMWQPAACFGFKTGREITCPETD